MNKTIVLGSINQDVIVTTPVHPQVGATVFGDSISRLPGGKGANEAVASASAGVPTKLIGAVGNDMAAAAMLSFLRSRNVDVEAVAEHPDAPTGTALITVSSDGENTIVIVAGANDTVVDNPDVALKRGDVLLSQFEVPRQSIEQFFARGRVAGCTNILNLSPVMPIPPALIALVDVLVVNEVELAFLARLKVDDLSREAIKRLARTLLPGNRTVVVTLGSAGAVAATPDGMVEVSGLCVDAVDTTGAGDCFVGSLAAELARGDSFESALEFANRAAATCVTKPGAGPSMPLRSEVIPPTP